MTQPPPLPPHPSDWAAGELKDDEWQARLGPAELEEIDAALAESAQQPPETLTRDSFRLPELGARLRTIRDALEEGRGLFLLRGPVRIDASASLRTAAT